MTAYILRRLGLLLPTLFGVSVIAFVLVRLLPGSVLEQMYAQYGAIDAHTRTVLSHQLGLDRPLVQQYGIWVWGVLHGNLGNSLRSSTPVWSELSVRLPVDIELGLLSMVISLLIAIPIGIISAVRQNRIADYVARGFAIGALSIPYFWVAILIVVFPSIWWHVTPPLQYHTLFADPIANLEQVGLAAVVLGIALSGTVMRVTRTTMLEILRQDYIRTARAKGLGGWKVIVRHALKNAMLPVITIIGLQVPLLIGGAVILEQIFILPGVGRYLLDAVLQRDYPIVQAINLLVAVVVVVVNLGIDLTYAVFDPRIRYS